MTANRAASIRARLVASANSAKCKWLENAKLNALKEAARQGWTDVANRRYADVADDQLEDFIGQLGRRSAQLPHPPD